MGLKLKLIASDNESSRTVCMDNDVWELVNCLLVITGVTDTYRLSVNTSSDTTDVDKLTVFLKNVGTTLLGIL
jgi:hypothetical protein